MIFNLSFVLISFFLLASLFFNTRLASDVNLSNPSLLACSTNTSFVMLSLLCLILFSDLSLVISLPVFNDIFLLFFLFVVICVSFVSTDFHKSRSIIKFEYDIFIITAVLSAICLCFVNDFMIFFLALELQSFTFYILATFQRNSEFSTEAGLKYFIFGAVISSFLLLGLCFLYSAVGSTSFEALFSLLFSIFDPIHFFGFVFILVTLLFKVGSAPFHFWLCDVYDGAILSVTLLFSAAPKIILFSLFLKFFFFFFFDFKEFWAPVVLVSCVLSIFFGTVSAFYQKKIKRLLGYSTIGHTGFILLGLLAATMESSTAVIIYVGIYAFLTLLTFSLLIFAASSKSNNAKFLANWASLGLKNMHYALTFTVVLFSVAGIPPLAGFFSKLFVLLTAISSQYFLTSVFFIILSASACFFYIRLIKIFFFGNVVKNTFWLSQASKQNTETLIGLFLFFNFFLFLKLDSFMFLATILSFCLF